MGGGGHRPCSSPLKPKADQNTSVEWSPVPEAELVGCVTLQAEGCLPGTEAKHQAQNTKRHTSCRCPDISCLAEFALSEWGKHRQSADILELWEAGEEELFGGGSERGRQIGTLGRIEIYVIFSSQA